jgi:hypothetical protein
MAPWLAGGGGLPTSLHHCTDQHRLSAHFFYTLCECNTVAEGGREGRRGVARGRKEGETKEKRDGGGGGGRR